MMFKRIYSIHILLATFILSSGCGVNNLPASKITIFSLKAAMRPVQDISISERNIASSICLALKSKSQNFKTSEYLGTKFIFQNKERTCLGQNFTTTINSILKLQIDETLHYANNDKLLNDFAQTNSSGYLSQICTKIDNNQSISNTISLKGISVQINFFKDVLDGYAIQYFTQLADGSSQMTSAESFKIRTQLTYTVNNIMGMDEYYAKESVCPTDSTKSALAEQIFIGR